MSDPGLEVEPDVVRRAAVLVAEAADLAHRPVAHTAVTGLGTPGLDAAADALVFLLGTGATVLGDALAETAEGLRAAADGYAAREQDAVEALRLAARPDADRTS